MSDESLISEPADENIEDEELAVETERKCPATAILVGISLGILAGTAIAIALRPPSRRAAIARSLQGSSERLAELLESAAAEVRKPLERTRALAADAGSQASRAIARLADRKKKKCCFWS